MARVHLEGLGKVFPSPGGPVHAVRALDLEIARGEYLVVVGPSGSGKSTLLRLIAGLEEPTRGALWIDGLRVNAVDPKDRDVAMVFQDHALYPHLTVGENLSLGLELRRLPPDEIAARVDSVAGRLGIGSLLGRGPGSLSGGERQRVALGRALVRRPKVLLLDEPLSDLDPPMRLQLRAELSRLHRELGTTVIHVTHDQAEAMTLGARVVVMSQGAVQQVADPATLYGEPANRFVAAFIGSPPVGFLPGRVVLEQGAATFFVHDAPGDPALKPFRCPLANPGLEAGEAVLGLRPEHLGIAGPACLATLEARVDFVDWAGPEILVHLSRGPARLSARLPASERPAPGSLLSLGVKWAGALLFDAVSGRRFGRAAIPGNSGPSSGPRF